ncbi:MAG TPA: TIGR03118 family protein [Pyrinomonadaceae bacterium]|nr:TIGR03118 family protein [Pyrinomonadaceae bacterium]
MLRLTSSRVQTRKLVSLSLSFFLCLCLLPVLPAPPAGAKSAGQTVDTPQDQIPLIPVIAPGSAYIQTNLVSDSPGVAPVQDPLLVNPWGISLTASSPFWVANNGTSTSTLYRGDVPPGSPFIKNPGFARITIPGGLPTGTVANGVASEFVLPGACASPPCGANFLFASETGNIVGWDPNAPAAGSTTGVIAASHPGHVYKGLAIANNGGNNFLYAADFVNGAIDVYNSAFALQPAASFPFADPTIPTTPGNTYHPFNIQAIGSSLYVAYAKVGTDEEDEAGVGNGFVRRFNTAGVRDLTFGINNGALNSPWGIVLAPASFGIFGGALLVGNFGEGNPSIHAFNSTTGAFLGTLQDQSGNGIVIDELWDLKFGNGGDGGDPDTLYFAAGIGEENHGLFGKLNKTIASATSLVQFGTDDSVISENTGHIDITVTRAGDVSGGATVNYATFDEDEAGNASQKSDYQIAVGKLTFAPGETSQTFRLLLVNDVFDETDEVITLILSNPTGDGVGLGSPNTVEITILDDDTGAPTTNPIDDAQFFVRQHYLDFLNREPDADGLAFWTGQITSCGADAACIQRQRVIVSAAFFLSIEFQRTGLLALLTNQAAFGAKPLYGVFERDTQALQKDVIFGTPGAEAQLEANTEAFFADYVTRPEFVAKYPATLTDAQYVDNLLASAGLSPSNFIVNLTNSQENPPTNPTTTGGVRRPASFGTATFSLNAGETAMTMSATINNLDFTGAQTADTNDNLTNAHIHAGAAVTPTVNGPVVWGFIGTPFNDNNPNDAVVTPFGSGVGGTVNAKWDAPEGNATTLAAQLSNIKEGRAYVNFHSTQFPGGEIRGNFPAMTPLRDSLVAGLTGGTETRASVLRKVAEFPYLNQREFNSAFVLMEYFGYLRRDPDTAGFNFWLDKLNSFNGNFLDAEMVRAFIESIEYRQRFGS